MRQMGQLGLGLLNRRGGGFSPASLFASGGQGAWYDPSDLTTMATGAGVSPTAGQTVRHILDKSKGLTLGADIMVNGGFDDASGWTTTGFWTISGGVASVTAGGFSALVRAVTGLAAGKAFEVEFDTNTSVSASIDLRMGGALGTSLVATFTPPLGISRQTLRVAQTIAGTDFRFVTSTAFVGTIDNITIKEIPGTHAQQTTSGDRPTLRFENDVYYLENVSSDTISWTASPGTYTIAYANAAREVTFLTEQALSGATNALLLSEVSAYLAINRELTARETAQVEAFFLNSSTPLWVAALSDGSGGKIYPVAQVDLLNNRGWWDGSERDLSEFLTNNVDGSFSFTEIPPGLETNDGSGDTVSVDWRLPPRFDGVAADYTGMLFSWIGAGNVPRFEMNVVQTINPASLPPGGAYTCNSFVGYAGANIASSGRSALGGSLVERTEGIRRDIIAIPPGTGSPVKTSNSGGIVSEALDTTVAYNAPTAMDIGRWCFNDTAVLGADTEVCQVIIYNVTLTDAQIKQLSGFNPERVRPLCFIGDSLNNGSQPLAALRLENYNRYIPAYSDGAGGRGVNYFAGMIGAITTAVPDLAAHRLIMFEGGLDLESIPYPSGDSEGPFTDAEIVGWFQDCLDEFSGENHIIMLPHTNLRAEQGPSELAQLQATIVEIEDAFPGICLNWEDELRTQAVPPDTYEQLTEDSKTPVQLQEDDIHINWTSTLGGPGGYAFAAKALDRFLKEKGWL